jgi:LPS export ABC transporter protein LptC
MKMLPYKLASIGLFTILLLSCTEVKKAVVKKSDPYTGPQVISHDLDVVFTDSARLNMKMKAKKQIILQNEDQEFTEGFALEFYNKNSGLMYSTLNSNYAYFDQVKNRWLIRGTVVVKNTEKGQMLETEELYWEPEKGDILVEDQHKVTITEPDQVLYGMGLKAKDDFSYYKIKQPTGMKFL